MKTVIIVQARMGSTRLPGKVLMPILGRPMIAHQLDRLERVREADDVVVATTTEAADDEIEKLIRARHGVGIFRGSEEDVLDRFHEAARAADAAVVVRVTADCPLIEPAVIDKCICLFRASSGSVDYVSNCLYRRFPRGLDTEVFSFQALCTAHREATARRDREHVTPYIWSQPERFRLMDLQDDQDWSHLRWTVDTPEDFEFVTRVYQALYPAKTDFSYFEVLDLVQRHPNLTAINQHIEQKPYGR